LLHRFAVAIIVAAAIAAVPGSVPAQPAPGSAHRAAIEARATQAVARGQFGAAVDLVDEFDATDGFRLLIEGRVALERGEYDRALELLGRARLIDPQGEAALELGLLHMTLGQTEPGARVLSAVVESGAASHDARGLARAARAARALGQYRLANSLFRNASRLAPDSASINTWWGELFLEKHNRSEAQALFNRAIEADPDYAPAQVGLAMVLADDDPPASALAAQRALVINPASVVACVHLARLAADSDRDADAQAMLSRALEVNPSSFEARALRAALARADDQIEPFQREVTALLALRPSYGEVYRVTAEALARRYRFDEALEMAERAVEVDAANARARAELGLLLLRTGDEARARQVLERAFEQDPFDAVTFNLLGLLDTLAQFETVERETVHVRLHPDDAPVLRELAPALAVEALATLSARYAFEPRGPILVELFPRHDDFAVRTLGLPGMIGALGACFGRVVTLDSPRARPPGTFNWEATLWHEMAHVITLQMSAQRVPRWLSEGVSVFEERRARLGWGRESHEEFVRAFAEGRTLPLSSLARGFTDPTTITLAYHQASLVVEHIVERFGEAALHGLLRAFGEGLDEPAALRRALGVDVEELQVSFSAYLDDRYGAVRVALATPDDAVTAITSSDVPALREAAREHPGSFEVLMALAKALTSEGDRRGALDAYARADALVPGLTGESSPRAAMASAAERIDDPETAMRSLEVLLEHDPAALEPARALARWAETTGDRQRAANANSRIASVTPFDAEAHGALGRLAMGEGQLERAIWRFGLALAAGPADPSVVHTDLAEALVLVGQPREAKRHVIAALERAPRYERAQDLLLRLVDGDSTRAVRP